MINHCVNFVFLTSHGTFSIWRNSKFDILKICTIDFEVSDYFPPKYDLRTLADKSRLKVKTIHNQLLVFQLAESATKLKRKTTTITSQKVREKRSINSSSRGCVRKREKEGKKEFARPVIHINFFRQFRVLTRKVLTHAKFRVLCKQHISSHQEHKKMFGISRVKRLSLSHSLSVGFIISFANFDKKSRMAK